MAKSILLAVSSTSRCILRFSSVPITSAVLTVTVITVRVVRTGRTSEAR
jgi:hypothetical protein